MVAVEGTLHQLRLSMGTKPRLELTFISGARRQYKIAPLTSRLPGTSQTCSTGFVTISRALLCTLRANTVPFGVVGTPQPFRPRVMRMRRSARDQRPIPDATVLIFAAGGSNADS